MGTAKETVEMAVGGTAIVEVTMWDPRGPHASAALAVPIIWM